MTISSLSLRNVLLLDAITCVAAGAAMLGGAALLEPLTGLPVSLLRGAGLVLLPFAAFLFWTARNESRPASAVWAAAAVNVAWVLASVAVTVDFRDSLTALGVAFVLAQALAVALLTALELAGIRRYGQLAHS